MAGYCRHGSSCRRNWRSLPRSAREPDRSTAGASPRHDTRSFPCRRSARGYWLSSLLSTYWESLMGARVAIVLPTFWCGTDRLVSMEKTMNRLSNLPLERALQIIGGRWKLYIVCHLQDGPLRLSQLQRGIPGISQKVLIQQLREL